MENNNSNTETDNTKAEPKNTSMAKFGLIGVAVLIILVSVVLVYISDKDEEVASEDAIVMDLPENGQDNNFVENVMEESTTNYVNGGYLAEGVYESPGGETKIGVSLTLVNDVVEEVSFESRTENPTSLKFQGEFAGGFEELVVGKNIDEISIDKVAGSSLTPIGFRDALEKIKAQAKS